MAPNNRHRSDVGSPYPPPATLDQRRGRFDRRAARRPCGNGHGRRGTTAPVRPCVRLLRYPTNRPNASPPPPPPLYIMPRHVSETRRWGAQIGTYVSPLESRRRAHCAAWSSMAPQGRSAGGWPNWKKSRTLHSSCSRRSCLIGILPQLAAQSVATPVDGGSRLATS